MAIGLLMLAALDYDGLPTPQERVMILELPRTPVLDDTQTLSVDWRPEEGW